jgi:thymidine phosphorylase
MDDWRGATFAYGTADRNDTAELASLRRSLEEADQRGVLDEVCSRYLAIWRAQSLAAADDYLIGLEERRWIKEVATGREFEEHRVKAGFPRPSERT